MQVNGYGPYLQHVMFNCKRAHYHEKKLIERVELLTKFAK